MSVIGSLSAHYRLIIGSNRLKSAQIGLVVRERKTLDTAIDELGLDKETDSAFLALLEEELAALEGFNCARYRLTTKMTQAWIADGRPR